MHSSRMRTVCCSSCVLGGGVYPRGGVSACQGRGVCPGGVCLLGGVWLPRGVSACRGRGGEGLYTSPCGQTDTCENITFPQLLLRTVKRHDGENVAKMFTKYSQNTYIFTCTNTFPRTRAFQFGMFTDPSCQSIVSTNLNYHNLTLDFFEKESLII